MLVLTPAQAAERARLMAGVAVVNDKPIVNPEIEAAKGAAKRDQRQRLAADKVDAVRALQDKGFKVFPITPGEKAPPLIKDWPRLATDDPALAGLWQDNHEANIGIHCEGLVVIDVDVRSGGDYTFAALEMVEDLPETLVHRTPTGGRHVFYRLPAGHPGVQNGAGVLGAGLDVKSTRGYVVAPGSKVEAGVYKVDNEADIADAPDWLLVRLGVAKAAKAPSKVQNVPDAHDVLVERAREWIKSRPQGDQAYATACGLRDQGLSATQALEVLTEHDGRPANVLQNKVDHAYKYAQNEPGAAVARPEDFPVLPVEAPSVAALADFSVVATESPEAEPQSDTGAAKPRGPKRMDDFAAGATEGAGYVIKGLLQRSSYAVAYGPPGSGKTFAALDMAYHVAAGKPWMEKRVRQGAVLYLPYEGAGGMRARAAALKQHYGDASVPLYFDDGGYNLRDKAGRQALGGAIAALPSKPSLIVIDTLAHALCGGDENSAQDVSAFNAGVQALIKHTGACVLVIHHPGKNIDNGARGSSALLGAVDTEIKVHERRIQPTKQRDVEMCEPIGFKLSPVAVGVDEDGDVVTSCVIEPSSTVRSPEASKLKEGSNQKLAYDLLVKLRPENNPITEKEWKEACDEFLPRGDRGRKAWFDARNRLERHRLVERREDGTWVRRME